MTARPASPPSRMPTALQGVALLNLHAGRKVFANGVTMGTYNSLEGLGWITPSPQRLDLTDDGRTALATWLLRDLEGPYVATGGQPVIFADEARALLVIVAGRNPRACFAEPCLHDFWKLGWVDRDDGITANGRSALASYLLRGWRP